MNVPSAPLPELPDRAALLLDLDGTLLDIAATPAAVQVPADLPDVLLAMRAALDDALAVVSGRPTSQIDALLGAVPFAVAGEHGAAIRHRPDGALERPALPAPPPEWLEQARHAASVHPGALLEPKPHGFVLHFRQCPDAGPDLQAAMLRIVDGQDGAFVVMPAHMAWELKPRGADKGRAVRSVMARAPFAGRVPVYVGDDVTDEDGMQVARELGGVGLRVQEHFGDAAGVRAWLAGLAHAQRGNAA